MSDDYEFIMLTNDGCPHCATARSVLKDKIDSGRIRVMDVSRDNGALELANKFEVNAVPTIIVSNKATKMAEVCDLKRDLSGVICKDNEVEF